MTPPRDTTTEPVLATPDARPRWARPWRSAVLGRVATMLVLAAGVPLFLSMPPWNDVTLHDMAARGVLRGKVHYEYVFDTNLPGIDWVMAAIRSAFGWSYEVLRGWDLVVIGVAAGILGLFARRSGGTRAAVAWYAAAVALFYPFTSEFNHCQRDPWMLLPVAVATWMRLRRVTLQTGVRHNPLARSVLEGVVWGCAVWIKPHALIMAASVWLVAAVLLARITGWRVVWRDLLGLLVGGVLVGGSGITWLVATGAWPYFWDIFTNWNPEYMSGVWREIPQRLSYVFWFFRPWSLLHAAAIPIAALHLLEAVSGKQVGWIPSLLSSPTKTPQEASARAILAMLYLGWLTQGIVLQKGFDYVHVPETILGLAVLAGQGWAVGFAYLVWFTVVGVLLNLAEVSPTAARFVPTPGSGVNVLRVEKHPLADAQVMRLWPRCWQEGSSPQLRDRLGHYTDVHCGTSWQDLDNVARFLQSVEPAIRDRELTCWHDSTHPLYLMLNLDPSTRYMHYGTVFPLRSKVPQLREEVARSPQRYVVSDLRRMTYDSRLAVAAGESGPNSLPAWFPHSQRDRFPWDQPIVYRSGRYLVHKVVHPIHLDTIDIPDWYRLNELSPRN